MKIGIVGTYAHLITYLSIFQSNWNNLILICDWNYIQEWLCMLHVIIVQMWVVRRCSISFSYFTNKENSIMLCLKKYYFVSYEYLLLL
jgi:hypothetical protein